MSTLMQRARPQRALALLAIVFGLVTLAAGGSALLGLRDPGYTVFMPLLTYNAIMGLAYVATGVAGWNSAAAARNGAWLIFLANAVMLGVVVWFHFTSDEVAMQSVGAMSFRTALWLGLFLGFRRLA